MILKSQNFGELVLGMSHSATINEKINLLTTLIIIFASSNVFSQTFVCERKYFDFIGMVLFVDEISSDCIRNNLYW